MGDKVLFNLSETEVDTIQIEYIVRQTECFDIKELKGFYYNDQLIESDNGIYMVEK